MYARDRDAIQLRRASHRSLGIGKPLDHRDGQRHCSHPECEARLSRYNPSPTCALHGGWDDGPKRQFG